MGHTHHNTPSLTPLTLALQLNRRIQRTKAPIPKFELQLLFMVYCPNAQLDVAKGSKLIKECPGLATPPHLTLKELEMIFAKVSRAEYTSVCLSSFCPESDSVACMHWLIDRLIDCIG